QPSGVESVIRVPKPELAQSRRGNEPGPSRPDCDCVRLVRKLVRISERALGSDEGAMRRQLQILASEPAVQFVRRAELVIHPVELPPTGSIERIGIGNEVISPGD